MRLLALGLDALLVTIYPGLRLLCQCIAYNPLHHLAIKLPALPVRNLYMEAAHSQTLQPNQGTEAGNMKASLIPNSNRKWTTGESDLRSQHEVNNQIESGINQ